MFRHLILCSSVSTVFLRRRRKGRAKIRTEQKLPTFKSLKTRQILPFARKQLNYSNPNIVWATTKRSGWPTVQLTSTLYHLGHSSPCSDYARLFNSQPFFWPSFFLYLSLSQLSPHFYVYFDSLKRFLSFYLNLFRLMLFITFHFSFPPLCSPSLCWLSIHLLPSINIFLIILSSPFAPFLYLHSSNGSIKNFHLAS